MSLFTPSRTSRDSSRSLADSMGDLSVSGSSQRHSTRSSRTQNSSATVSSVTPSTPSSGTRTTYLYRSTGTPVSPSPLRSSTTGSVAPSTPSLPLERMLFRQDTAPSTPSTPMPDDVFSVSTPTTAPPTPSTQGQPTAVQAYRGPPIDIYAHEAALRQNAASILKAGRARIRCGITTGGHIVKTELEPVVEGFKNFRTRWELADLAARDEYEDIQAVQRVHPWWLVETNKREKVVEALQQDIINAIRLCDRLCDTVSFFAQSRPEAYEGHKLLDVAVEPEVTAYKARAVRCAATEYEPTFELMVEAFRHGIAAPHAAAFTARKEARMSSGSKYRNLVVLRMVNRLPARRFVAGPMVVGLHDEPWGSRDLVDTMERHEARERWVRQKGGLPRVPTFDVAVRDHTDLRGPTALAVRNVVLDTQPSCRGLDEWAFIFRDQYGLEHEAAARLVHAALTDLLAVRWPL